MNRLKVSHRLLILLGNAVIGFAILLLVTELGMRNLGELQDSGHQRDRESAEIQATAKIGAEVYQVIADSIINRNLVESAKDWKEIKAETEAKLARANEITDTPEQKQEVEKAINAFHQLARIYESNVVPLLHADADLKEIRPLDDAMDVQAQIIHNSLLPLAQSLSAEADEADKNFDTTRSRTISISLVSALGLLGIMLVVAGYVGRSITRQLGGEPTFAMEVCQKIANGDLTTNISLDKIDSQSLMASMRVMQENLAQLIRQVTSNALHVSSAAEELATASNQVSASSIQQSNDTAAVAASVEELTVSIDQVATHAHDAEDIATESGKRSDEGAVQVKNATDEMTKIAQSVNETASQMTDLAEQSQQISSIANVIKDVADQTNLLALNAAIEAARAGEQGRGFAVVADEVRKLAERTTKSAQEISAMTASIEEHSDKATVTMRQGNDRVTEGVAIAKQAGESMHQISEGSRVVVHAVTDISNALREQKAASSEIARKVESIAQMTEQNSAAVANVADTAGRLKSLADELKLSVSGFRV